MPPNCLLWWREKFVATPTYYNAHCFSGNCAIYWVFKFGSTTWKIDERINVWQEERQRERESRVWEWNRESVAAGQVLRINDGAGWQSLCQCCLSLLGFRFCCPLFTSCSSFSILLSMPLWVWRICAHFQINAAIIVYRWSCWHCAQWFTCPAYLFALQLFHFSSVCQSNFPGFLRKQVQYCSPLSHSHFPDAIAMLAFCLLNEIDRECILQ